MKSHLDLAFILKYKNALLKVEETDILDIKKVWFEQENKDYTNEYLLQKELPRDWRDACYMKMIHRFRDCDKRIAVFYHQIDPGNQFRLLRYFFNNIREGSIGCFIMMHETMEFLAWTSNMLGGRDIHTLFVLKDIIGDEEALPADEIINRINHWKERPIDFFFSLRETAQIYLVNRYNTQEIDSYNEFMNERGNENQLEIAQKIKDARETMQRVATDLEEPE